jgi:predicted GNAT family acetyltransferase
MYDLTKHKIEEYINEQIKINRKSLDKSFDPNNSGDPNRLIKYTDIPTEKANVHTISFNGEETNQEYAVCRYIIFSQSNISLIDWLEVNDQIQNKGIGRILRREMISEMDSKNINIMYTKIINHKIISVVIDQGFRQIQDGGLKGWFVRD